MRSFLMVDSSCCSSTALIPVSVLLCCVMRSTLSPISHVWQSTRSSGCCNPTSSKVSTSSRASSSTPELPVRSGTIARRRPGPHCSRSAAGASSNASLDSIIRSAFATVLARGNRSRAMGRIAVTAGVGIFLPCFLSYCMSRARQSRGPPSSM